MKLITTNSKVILHMLHCRYYLVLSLFIMTSCSGLFDKEERRNEKDDACLCEPFILEVMDVCDDIVLMPLNPHTINGVIIKDDSSMRNLMRNSKEFGNLQYLWINKVYNQKDTLIPAEIISFKKLVYLLITNNALNALPDDINELNCLEVLNVQMCDATELPESVGDLTNLRELNLYCTPIQVLPESIKNLTSLQVLVLGGDSYQGKSYVDSIYVKKVSYSIPWCDIHYFTKKSHRIYKNGNIVSFRYSKNY